MAGRGAGGVNKLDSKLNTPPLHITDRIPIWLALSNLYLDTELQEDFYLDFAQKIKASPYSLEEVKAINKYEVFPVLQSNLTSVAGEWASFEEAWLIERITTRLKKRTKLSRLAVESSFYMFKRMQKEHWEKLENHYNGHP